MKHLPSRELQAPGGDAERAEQYQRALERGHMRGRPRPAAEVDARQEAGDRSVE